jgi:hypothetical protein
MNSDKASYESPEEVSAIVYAVLTDLSIVRLRAGNRLFGFGPRVPGAPPLSSFTVGMRCKLLVGPRLNKVLGVEILDETP